MNSPWGAVGPRLYFSLGMNVRLAAGVAEAMTVMIMSEVAVILRVFLCLWFLCVFWMVCWVFLIVYSIVRRAKMSRRGISVNAYLCCMNTML